MKMTPLALLLGTLMTPPEPNPVGTVLFVCEHGSHAPRSTTRPAPAARARASTAMAAARS